MTGILLKIALVLEILFVIYLLLYLGGAIMAWSNIKRVFTCKKCNKMNTLLKKKCEHCDADMKQWVARYKNCLFRRIDCINDDGVPSWKVSKGAVIFDYVVLGIAIVLVIVAMVFTIIAI